MHDVKITLLEFPSSLKESMPFDNDSIYLSMP
jgi:hypothetical protein